MYSRPTIRMRHKAILLAGVAVLLCAGTRASAANAEPEWVRLAGESDRREDTEKSSIPAEYDRAEIVKMLKPTALVVSEDKVESLRLLLVKPWQASPSLSVAAMNVVTYAKSGAGGAEDSGSTVYVAVFAGGKEGAKIDLKARTTMDVRPEERLLKLDLAAYRLSPSQVAVGVRISRDFINYGGGGTNEYVYLLLPDGQDLRRGWATRMASTSLTASSMHKDGSREHFTHGEKTPATITVLKSTTRGLFDLRKSQSKRSSVYQWDGTSYTSNSRDPVSDVNPR
jgi:hypothetical protein